MKKALCPRCSSFYLEEIGEGNYKCNTCGYKGMLGIEKEFILKG